MDKTKRSEYAKRHYILHREENCARMRAYRAANREKVRVASRAWYVANKEKIKTYNAQRLEERRILKDSKKGGISNIGPCQWTDADGVCGWDKTPNDRHRLKFGGAYVHENVILLCPNHHRLAHQEARK